MFVFHAGHICTAIRLPDNREFFLGSYPGPFHGGHVTTRRQAARDTLKHALVHVVFGFLPDEFTWDREDPTLEPADAGSLEIYFRRIAVIGVYRSAVFSRTQDQDIPRWRQ